MFSDYLIIGLVSVIALAAHIALFRWVRFKIDEGVISKYLEDRNASSSERAVDFHAIVLASDIAERRCYHVCSHSGRIRLDAGGNTAWLADSRRL